MDKENKFSKNSKYFYHIVFIKREPRVQMFSETKLLLVFYDPDKKEKKNNEL